MSPTFDNWTAVILAAGQGMRMRSSLPKTLHPLAGRPMARWVLEAARGAGFRRCVVVVGRDSDDLRAALGDEIEYAVQPAPQGTGHAVAQAREAAGDAEQVLVLNGDVPLITAETLARRYEISRDEQDAFAAQSQQRCETARNAKRFEAETIEIQVPGRKGPVVVRQDEHPRDGVTVEALAKIYKVSSGMDLTPFWKNPDDEHGSPAEDSLVDSDSHVGDELEDFSDFHVAAPVGPPKRPTVKKRPRRRPPR